MFYLVDIHEVFANINGSDQLRKLLGKPLKAVAVARRSSGPVVHNIWVIPGHIIVSLNDGTLLLAFDLLPKLRPWPSIPNLLQDPRSSSAQVQGPKSVVLNVISYKDYTDTSFALVVCRKGKIVCWKFTRPKYEWEFVGTTELCKGAKTQIVSASFSNATMTLLWCERRTPTQCCICKATLSHGGTQSTENGIQLSGIIAVLHNCIPMQVTLVDETHFLFTPVAKTDQEILLFWDSRRQTLQVFVWPFDNNETLQPVKSSDYRSIVMDTLSFWINADCDSILPFVFCVNHSSNELFILQKDCRLYILTLDKKDKKPRKRYATTLQLGRWKESFKKKPAKLFTWNIFVGLLQYDGNILLFEITSGSCVCIINSLEKSLPKLWISNDEIPKIGFWNYSGLWLLRAEHVTKQAEHLIRVLSGNKSYEGPYRLRTARPSHNHVHVGSMSPTENVLQKQRSNSSIAIEALAELNFEMSSQDFIHVPLARACLPIIDYLLVLNMKQHAAMLVADIVCKSEIELDSILSAKEIIKLLNLFDDPVMLLSVFYRKLEDIKLLNSRLLLILNPEHLKPSLSLSEGTLSLLSEYLKNTKIDTQETSSQVKDSISISSVMQYLVPSSVECDPEILSVALKDIASISGKECANAILHILKLDDSEKSLDNGPKVNGLVQSFDVSRKLWNEILRYDGVLFCLVCNLLFEHNPDYLHPFVITASRYSQMVSSTDSTKQNHSTTDHYPQRALSCLHLPTKGNCQQPINQSRLCAYVNLLLASDFNQKELKGLTVYLNYEMYDAAFSLLEDGRIDSKIRNLLFHTMSERLLQDKTIGKYATKLSRVVPHNFTMIQFSLLVRSIINTDNSSSKEVFDSDGYFAISELKPLLDVLISRQSIEDFRTINTIDQF